MNLHLAQRGAQASARNRAAMAKTGMTAWGTVLWTVPEDELLRSHYPDYDKLCVLLPHRTRKALECRCEKLDITSKLKAWNAREVSLLRRLWSTATKAELRDAFPGYSWKSISSAAERRHFKRPRRHYVRVPSPQANAIRDRCFELGYKLKDVDALARTKKYFQQGSTYGPRPNMKRMDQAIRALDGKLVVAWNE